jgi:phosphatidate phosphatase APP1
MPFVLIGDSGQHDPEIYAAIVREHPDRVTAVYIRDVSRSSNRRREIDELAAEIRKAGSSLVIADDTYAMARHAAGAGLISDASLKRVLNERVSEAEPQVRARKGPVVVEG